jgi:hypothetical protein
VVNRDKGERVDDCVSELLQHMVMLLLPYEIVLAGEVDERVPAMPRNARMSVY